MQKGLFQAEARSYLLRGDLAERLYASDPARAMALVESVTPPMLQIENLTRIAQLLPASERARKRELLERATALIPKVTAGLQQRLRSIITVSGGWLDMDEPDRARHLVQEGKAIYDLLPPERAGILSSFLVTLARLEPDQAELRIKNLVGYPAHDSRLAEAAVQLAIDRPAEAERFFNLREERGLDITTHAYAMQLVRRLAQVRPIACSEDRRIARRTRRKRLRLGLRGLRPV